VGSSLLVWGDALKVYNNLERTGKRGGFFGGSSSENERVGAWGVGCSGVWNFDQEIAKGGVSTNRLGYKQKAVGGTGLKSRGTEGQGRDRRMCPRRF